MYGYRWRPYVSVTARRRQAAREMAKLTKKGKPVSPVVIEGRRIARTFWGKAWCENLEHYSDFSNRLPRGRTYVRNGSVLDLQIAPGEVKALVSGSSIYKVAVKVTAVPKARWTSICRDCTGEIDSLVELLQGRFSAGVMERICRQKTGLFPAPVEIRFSCSCPDWASMCKHVAAVLYGTGARLDTQPELLFKLRQVDEKDLIAKAGRIVPLSRTGPAAHRVLAADGLAEIFGLEMAATGNESGPARRRTHSGAGASKLSARAADAAGAASTAKAKKTRARRSSSPPERKRPKVGTTMKARKRSAAKRRGRP